MWMAFNGDGEPIPGSESDDDPGMCMLYLMHVVPEEVGREFVDWLNMRDARAEAVVRSLFEPIYADALKERFLDFVAHFVDQKGSFPIMYSEYSIGWFEPEAEE